MTVLTASVTHQCGSCTWAPEKRHSGSFNTPGHVYLWGEGLPCALLHRLHGLKAAGWGIMGNQDGLVHMISFYFYLIWTRTIVSVIIRVSRKRHYLIFCTDFYYCSNALIQKKPQRKKHSETSRSNTERSARFGFPKRKCGQFREIWLQLGSETFTGSDLPVRPLAHTPDRSSVTLKPAFREGHDVEELSHPTPLWIIYLLTTEEFESKMSWIQTPEGMDLMRIL